MSLNQSPIDYALYMVHGMAGTFVLKVLNIVLALGTSFLLARFLGTKEYGVYAYAISWAKLLSVPAVMGLNTLLVREVSRYTTLQDWNSLRGILRWSNQVVLFTSAILASFVGFGIWLSADHFAPEIRTALWIVMASVPVFALLALQQGALRGMGYVIAAQIPEFIILPGIFLVLATGVYVVSDLSGLSAVGLRLIAGLIALLVSLGLLRRCSPSSLNGASPIYCRRQWLSSALPLLFVGSLGVINQQISTIMIGAMLGAKEVGIFDISSKAVVLVSFALIIVNMPLASAIVELNTRGEKKRLQRLVTKSTKTALLASLPIAFIMIFFGGWVLLIFGKEFTAGGTTLAILTIGQLFNVGMGPSALLLNMTGYERDTAKGMGIAALVNVLLNATLIPVWGIEGAAVANAVSTIAWNILLMAWAYRRLGICTNAFGKLDWEVPYE